MVVEDEPVLAAMIQSRLESNQYEVSIAGNGLEGLKQIERAKPDLIVMDIAMPQMDGYTLAKMLRSRIEFKEIPVIVVTAKGNQLKSLFELEGITDYLIKPFQAQELLERVKKHIG